MMIRNNEERRIFRSFSSGERDGLLCAGEIFKQGVTDDTVRAKYPFFCLVLVLEGRGSYSDDRGYKSDLHRGMVLQRLPDRKHTVRIDPESMWHEVFIGFGQMEYGEKEYSGEERPGDFWKADLLAPRFNKTSDILRALSLMDVTNPCFTLSGEDARLAGAVRSFAEKLERAESDLLPLLTGEAMGLFSRIWLAGEKGAGKPLDPVSEARRLLEEQAGTRCPVEKILSPLPLGYARLRERFREETGISPGRYRLLKRIELACSLLSADGKSSGETARVLGYDDTSSFSKQFRAVMGLSPGEYKRRQE